MLKKFIQTALLLVVLCTTATTYAQVSQAPDGIQFQALATDANGHPAAGRVIYVKDAIVAKTATGTIVYSETFKVTASSAGIFTIVLGKGTYAGGVSSIANIDWANGPFFLNLKIAVEPTVPTASWNVNNEYVDLGTSQFWSVPYALYAGNVKGADTKLNISDTAAMLKPYFTSINLKANIESPTFTGTVSGITKAMVGLGNVDNTADINKPVSTTTQAALDLKVDKAAIIGTNTGDQDLSALATNTALALKANTNDVTTSLATKVDKVTGKELSTNDYTTAEKTKLAAITGTNTGDQDLSALATNTALALKANTADVNTALDLKVDKVTGKALSTNDYTTAEKTKLAAIIGTNTGDQDLSALATNTALALKANTSDVNTALTLKANAADVTTALALKANVTDVSTALDLKVDKVTGKALSTNDYTTAEKTKLAAITGTNTGDQDLSALATNTALALKANTTDINLSLATKVDKVTGKELSTNDYTTAEKTKLAAITGTNTGDQINITGNAATATTAGNITATINTTLTSLSNLATVGTITSGVWSGTTVAVEKGGTGLISAGTNGQVLTSTGSGTLSWTTPSTIATGYSGTLPVANGGTGSSTQNFVDLSNNQTVNGYKSFSTNINANGIQIGKPSSGSQNTMLGEAVFAYASPGSNNTALGFMALTSLAGGDDNTAVGTNAIRQGGDANGSRNTAVGSHALGNGGVSNDNVAIGSYAMPASVTGSSNVALGSYALNSSTSANYNVGVGFESLKTTTTGGNNTAIGHGSMKSNTSGDVNTAVGENSLVSNTQGRYNTAIGVQAQEQNTIGGQNTAIGVAAIDQNQLGNNNAVLGAFAGRHFGSNYAFMTDRTTQIDNSVLIGYDARPLVNNSTNEIVIGYNAVGKGSNTIQLGNTSITNVNTSGTITAGGLSVSGNVAVNTNKFNVTAANGNTSVAGTLDVTGATTLSSATVNGKVIAGASSAASSSAVLEANSTTQGFLPPRMTYAQRNLISNPATGLIIFCSDCGLYGEPQFYDGNNNWRKFDQSLGSNNGTLNLVVDALETPTNGTQGPFLGQSFTTTSNPGKLVKIVTTAIGGTTDPWLSNGIAASYLNIRRWVNDNETTIPNALSGEILATSNTNPTILNYNYGQYYPTTEFTFPNQIVLSANTKYVIEFVNGGGLSVYVKITGTYAGGQFFKYLNRMETKLT